MSDNHAEEADPERPITGPWVAISLVYEPIRVYSDRIHGVRHDDEARNDDRD